MNAVYLEELNRIRSNIQNALAHATQDKLLAAKYPESEGPMGGQLSNHFVEGMRKIYALEPFIKMGLLPSEYLKKSQKRYQRAS